MPTTRRFVLLALALALLAPQGAAAGRRRAPAPPPVGEQTFSSPQANPLALSPDGSFLYVANTTSHSVSVINTASGQVVATVPVGLEPVGVAVRPGGNEVWVTNHVSDSVSVIDVVFGSPTRHTVVETIQGLDGSGVTTFDEPVGIAFADSHKAYVALSSRDEVAIVDADTYAVTGTLAITAQEPRALAVRGGRLYVAAFESSNQSELSICPDTDTDNPGPPPGSDPTQCTLGTGDFVDFIVQSPNIPQSDTRIVIDPDVPDRDLFVFDTATDTPVAGSPVSGVGTLLYGLAVSGSGRVFVTQSDARNAVNGLLGQNLDVLENRMFLNQIGRVDCSGPCSLLPDFELEPAPPAQPAAGAELATPYGIAISDDDSTLVVTAAGTSRVFTVDVSGPTPVVSGILDLDAGVGADHGQQIPKGVALRSGPGGAPQTAWVLNTLENTVSEVDVSNPSALVHVGKVAVGSDPTPAAVRRGRIAFNNAFASNSGTFSCESCHPDGHTDQLLWRIGGACTHAGCTPGEDHVRSTMPVRGLKNTLPLHWDGTLGDPFGGGNGAVGVSGNGGTDCSLGGPDGDLDCFRNLVDASLTGVMCAQPCTAPELTSAARDDMAAFLRSVAYPPPRSRRPDDSVSTSARNGFADFFLDQSGAGNLAGVRTCADMNSGCHALPLGADTNSSTLGGFDVPTMRGMTDRVLQFSLGITNAEEALVFANSPNSFELLGLQLNFPGSAALGFPWDPAQGFTEAGTFASAFTIFGPVYAAGPADMFQMFEEASTGFSGALGRQVTLNTATTQGPALVLTQSVQASLEAAAARGGVLVRARGARQSGNAWPRVTLDYDPVLDEYRSADGALVLQPADLVSEAQAGTLLVTLTGMLPQGFGSEPQPLLSVTSTADGATGNPNLPVLPGGDPMTLRGIDVHQSAQVLVDGQVVSATLSCQNGSFGPYCSSNTVRIDLGPTLANGLHLLQVQNPAGPLSNELPICQGSVGGCL